MTAADDAPRGAMRHSVFRIVWRASATYVIANRPASLSLPKGEIGDVRFMTSISIH